MMKILLITQLPPPSGGIATWSEKYVSYCERERIPLAIVNTAMSGSRGENFHAKKNLITELKRTARIIRGIIKKKNEFMPDLVHFNTACSPTGIIRDYLCMIAIGRSVPVILHCRCTIQDQLQGNKLGMLFFQKAARRATKVIVLNDFSTEYVQSVTNKVPVKVANFVDENYISNGRNSFSEKIKEIVYIGHVHKEKGIDEIIETAYVFPKINFVLAGQVDEVYKKRTLPSNIKLMGNQPQDQIKDLLDSADVFLFPSYTEGFANSLAEAMARGVPVIASDVGANADMLENKGGIIVRTRNTEEVVNAIVKLEAIEIRRRMSEWNIQKVRNEYIVPNVMRRLFQIYTDAQNNV